MIKPTYHRQSRTLSSEQYQLTEGEERLGHLDLHYGSSDVFGTLVLDRELTEEEIEQLIEQIDEDLVLSVDVPRDEFLVWVYAGRDLGLYPKDLMRGDFDANGHEQFEDEL